MERLRVSFAQVVALYVVSGALGLIYEVAFAKYIGYCFGTTASASSAVLVAFMGGIAVGAYGAGRIAGRVTRPLAAYGVVEIAIGAFCLAGPILFGWLSTTYVSLASRTHSIGVLTSVRALFAIVIVACPAVGMGATLPLLARFIEGAVHGESAAERRRKIATLYGMNTLGGALGSLTCAYAILPTLGLSWTLCAAALVSLTIGAAALVLGRNRVMEVGAAGVREAPPDVHAEQPSGLPPRDLLIVAGLSGLLVFCSEVVFTHLLALVIGTSVYAFGLMLAIFLVCLSFGTPLAQALDRRTSSGALSVSLTVTGTVLLVSLPIWDRLPSLFFALGPYVRSWPGREIVRGLAAVLALAVPVSFMGTTFPLVLRGARGTHAARDVGRMTAVNTVGAIAGSLLAGFVIIERLGSRGSLVLVAAGYLAGGWIAVREASLPTRRRAAVLTLAGVALAVLTPGWSMARLTSGANVYFDKGPVENGVLESVHEDVHGGVTTVVRNPATNERTLLTNGKFQGNDRMELTQNRGFAFLPTFFTGVTDRALVIGMGTGVTAGTLAEFPYKRIDIAELAPAIVEAARTTFAGVNQHVLADPRVQVIAEDGRNVLFVRKDKYDVITVEVSSIWFAGAANLYNREFYSIARERLVEGGVLQQWIQFHHTNREIVATILGSVRVVFPHVLLFVDGHQGHILASSRPLRASVPRMEAFAFKRAMPYDQLLAYVEGIVLDTAAIDAFLVDTAAAEDSTPAAYQSTDDNLTLEYATPRGNVPSADDIPTTVRYLYAYKPRGAIQAHLRL